MIPTTAPTTSPATRTVDGLELPAPGVWAIDASHTTVGFAVRHLGLAKTRGRFGSFSGSVEVAERPEDSRVEVAIETASVDTRDTTRDEHLRSDDFFASADFPHLTFRSTSVRNEGGRWTVEGDLTIREITRPVRLDVEYEGVAGDPWGGVRAAFTARTKIDREAFGLTWNAALETGGFLVGKQVDVELDVELVRQ